MDAHRVTRRSRASGAAVFAMVLAAACSDVRVGVYSTIEEARTEGAIAKGWVPDGLPPGVSDIREAHDLDTNQRWGAFTFPAAQSAPLRALLDPSEIDRGAVACDPPGRLESWPPLLRTPVDVPQLRSLGFHLYRGRDAALLWVIHWPQGKAYYWTP
jgi:hypothetical protein